MSALSAPYMHDEAAAFAHIEAMLWPHGAVCPRCGVVGNAYELKGVRSKSSKKHPKGKERHGLKKCKDCGKQFTVRIGTIFEESHIELQLWLQAFYLMTSSKKGISSHQLARTLGITVKSAWFMSHRIREAMRTGSFKAPLGGQGETVEADETFIGRKKGAEVRRGTAHKMAVLSLVQRGGEVRSFPINTTKAREIGPIVNKHIAKESELMTDEASQYQSIGKRFASHGWVTHSAGQYVDGPIHSNTVEGYFSIFKRGMKGIYQHCSEKHLHRYLAEFDFRYNHREANGVNDKERADNALSGMVGKRLLYRDSLQG